MKGIILGAGYATRLYPLTKNMPKPLIHIANERILERIIAKFKKVDKIDRIFFVTNSKFYTQVEKWREDYIDKQNDSVEITVIDDGTLSNEKRLGPVGDISLALRNYNIKDDVLISAGDNLFEIDLNKMCEISEANNASVIGTYKFESIDHVREKFGVVVTDENNRVVDFEEKPIEPKSTLAATAIYVFPKNVLKYILELESRSHEKEVNLGEIIPELLRNNLPVYCENLSSWFDIGSHEDLKKAEEYYSSL